MGLPTLSRASSSRPARAASSEHRTWAATTGTWVADAGEPGDLAVAADGVDVQAEAGTPEHQDRQHRAAEHDQRRDRHRPDLLGADQPEVARRGAGVALVVGREVAADHQAGAERGDEAVHAEDADDEAVGESDGGGDQERDGDGHRHVGRVAGHPLGREHADQAGHERHRQVEAADQDHQRLTDRDEAQDAGAGEDRGDVALAEEVAVGRGRQDRADDDHHQQDAVDDAGRGEGAAAQEVHCSLPGQAQWSSGP